MRLKVLAAGFLLLSGAAVAIAGHDESAFFIGLVMILLSFIWLIKG